MSQATLSPENQKLWNRFGLTMVNGTVTLSIPALDLLLNAAWKEGAKSAALSNPAEQGEQR